MYFYTYVNHCITNRIWTSSVRSVGGLNRWRQCEKTSVCAVHPRPETSTVSARVSNRNSLMLSVLVGGLASCGTLLQTFLMKLFVQVCLPYSGNFNGERCVHKSKTAQRPNRSWMRNCHQNHIFIIIFSSSITLLFSFSFFICVFFPSFLHINFVSWYFQAIIFTKSEFNLVARLPSSLRQPSQVTKVIPTITLFRSFHFLIYRLHAFENCCFVNKSVFWSKC